MRMDLKTHKNEVFSQGECQNAFRIMNVERSGIMKEYTKPNAELVKFGNDKLNTASSTCNCFAQRWTFAEDSDDDDCYFITGDFSEVGDANNGL